MKTLIVWSSVSAVVIPWLCCYSTSEKNTTESLSKEDRPPVQLRGVLARAALDHLFTDSPYRQEHIKILNTGHVTSFLAGKELFEWDT